MASERLKNFELFFRKTVLPTRQYNYDLGDCRRWFVGGTGRSGTTFVATWLARAGKLYRVPIESKIVSEGGGLRDLVDQLTVSWSPSGAALALRNFDHLMRARLTGFEESSFGSWGYHHRLSRNPQKSQRIYFGALEKFYAAIPMVDFLMQNPPRYPLRGVYTPSDNIVERRILPARLDRSEATRIAAKLVDDMFSYGVKNKRAKGYIEKTPSNIYCADFILEMFPQARFIHCVRDPLNVVTSYCNQAWFSNRPEDAVQFLVWAYQRAVEICEKLQSHPGFMTVRLEDLRSDTLAADLESFLDIGKGSLDRKAVNEHHPAAADIEDLYGPLKPARRYFGYE